MNNPLSHKFADTHALPQINLTSMEASMFLNSKLFYMNNKTIIMNSTFISSEELRRSRSVLSALANPSHDTQPHAIIAKNK